MSIAASSSQVSACIMNQHGQFALRRVGGLEEVVFTGALRLNNTDQVEHPHSRLCWAGVRMRGCARADAAALTSARGMSSLPLSGLDFKFLMCELGITCGGMRVEPCSVLLSLTLLGSLARGQTRMLTSRQGCTACCCTVGVKAARAAERARATGKRMLTEWASHVPSP